MNHYFILSSIAQKMHFGGLDEVFLYKCCYIQIRCLDYNIQFNDG